VSSKAHSSSWLNDSNIVAAIPGGVLAFEPAGGLIHASPLALELLGGDESVVLGKRLGEFTLEERAGEAMSSFGKAASGRRETIDFCFSSDAGKETWARVSLSPVRQDEDIAGVVAIVSEVGTVRRAEGATRGTSAGSTAKHRGDLERAESRLRASQAQFSAVFENFPFECWALDRGARFVLQNPVSEKRWGNLISETIAAVDLPEETLTEWRADTELALTGVVARRDLVIRAGGKRKHFGRLIVPIRDGKDILGTLGVCIDTTEQRNLEEQLLQSQKLDAIGRLAGGIAHDFNNVLTAILSCVRLLERRLEGPPRRELQIIRDGAQRASELTRQLLAFAKQEMVEPRRTSVDDVVINSDRLLRRLIGEDIELVTLADASGWDVIVDPVRLEQAIINLVVNARDAMPKGGKITVKSQGVELAGSQESAEGSIPPGSYALIEVEDSGVGMSEETKTRAFEPFFTTRQDSGGTGLGLSSVYGSVHQAQGYVTLKSSIGEGTKVGLFLPRAEPKILEEESEAPEPPVEEGGSETILLVEDEPLVMSVACQSLRLSGYTVLPAQSPQVALELARAHEGDIDLLLTDVVMPHGTGPDLAETLRKERPTMTVLFMSGYTSDRFDVEIDPSNFLAKPFTPETLDAHVRKALDARPPKATGPTE
jgi:PAS domain S-box-containing protein